MVISMCDPALRLDGPMFLTHTRSWCRNVYKESRKSCTHLFLNNIIIHVQKNAKWLICSKVVLKKWLTHENGFKQLIYYWGNPEGREWKERSTSNSYNCPYRKLFGATVLDMNAMTLVSLVYADKSFTTRSKCKEL